MPILNRYRNALFNLLLESGLDPQMFAYVDRKIEGYDAFKIRVKGSRLYFTLISSRESPQGQRVFDCEYSEYIRDEPRPYIEEPSTHYWNWDDFASAEKSFKEWIESSARGYLDDKAEEAEDKRLPDLWAELKLPSHSATDALDLPNTPFSPEEQARVAHTLNGFVEAVKAQEILLAEQLAMLQGRVQHLIEASKKFGRKDWLLLATGSLLGCILQLGITAQTANQLIQLASDALRWIYENPFFLP